MDLTSFRDVLKWPRGDADTYYKKSESEGLVILAFICVIYCIVRYIYEKLLLYSSVISLIRSNDLIFWLLVAIFLVFCFYLCCWLFRKKFKIFGHPPDFYETQEWRLLARQVRERDNFTCQNCGVHGPRDKVALHVHHIKPRGRGGSDDPSNLITLCSKCHAEQPHHERLKNT